MLRGGRQWGRDDVVMCAGPSRGGVLGGGPLTPAGALPGSARRLVVAGGLAVAVTLALYAFGRAHVPDSTMGLLGHHGAALNRLKAELATRGARLGAGPAHPGAVDVPTAPRAGAAPVPVPVLHRVGGAALFLLALPVAVHCMFAYGVQLFDTRVALHSLAGCFFYGAFAAKVLIVRTRRLPGRALPVAGGLLVTLVAVIWYSSALWYFNGSR